MVTSLRVYAYGVTKDGVKEFIHTSLDVPGAISFLQKHRKLFGDRYPEYFYKTMNDQVEHYL
jgi:hypothetical protein